MLEELSIRNFAIIEDLTIRFESGLTILSGETGAGKSILINAVNLLLGSRVSAGLIRTGADQAELEAVFAIAPDSHVAKAMAEQGYDVQEGLLVRRIISRNDRHRIYINGRAATMQLLATLTDNLASISGQHAHQGLLKEEEHLFILDQYGGLLDLRRQYGEAYQNLIPLMDRARKLRRRQSRQGEQTALLQFQRDEIEAADIQPEEDLALEKERVRLKNGQRLHDTLRQCVDELYGIDGAIFERLGHLGKELAQCAVIDTRLQESADTMAHLAYGSEDLAATLRDHLSRIDLDPRQLDAVEERLDLVNRLKRKYGGAIDAVLSYAEDARRQLEEMENIDSAIAEAEEACVLVHKDLSRLAEKLSGKRKAAADKLARAVEAELDSLRMAGTRFAVELTRLSPPKDVSPYLRCKDAHLSEIGMDRAAFMMAPNVGEAIKPLAAIASGGELSRVVLALKAILAQNDSLETVVFDEVDAGIGGGAAELVGKKLTDLSQYHQILCITHLPQIAKYGRHHFRIEKKVDRGRTRTTITRLDPGERVEEVARMLGGEAITPATLAHAREMLAEVPETN
jgi:DNA repair protein RecN (Recombination protein N)